MEDENLMNEEELTDESLLSKTGKNTELLDAVKSYLLSIRQYKLLSKEEEFELFQRYREQGDLKARELLINHHLRLVVWCINKYKKPTTSYEFLDLVQEGNIGLIKSIEQHDYQSGYRLIAYAKQVIVGNIKNAIRDKDAMIRIAAHIHNNINKYRKYEKFYLEKYKRKPTKEEIIEYLDITEKNYNLMIETIERLNSVSSLDMPVNEEEDTSVLDFVPSYDSNFTNFEMTVDNQLFLYKLKKSLTPYQYYLIYYNILTEDKLNYKQLNKIFGITTSGVISNEISNVLKLIKRRNILNTDIKIDRNKMNTIDILPVDFSKKVILFYLQDKIEKDAFYYLYYAWYENKSKEQVKKKLEMQDIDYEGVKKYIHENCIEILNANEKTYKQILKQIKKQYTIPQIFAKDLKPVEVNTKLVEVFLSSSSYEEVKQILKGNFKKMLLKQKQSLYNYYDNHIDSKDSFYLNLVEAKINLQLLGYKEKRYIDIQKLYQTYLKNKDLFDDDHQEYLEGSLFQKFTGKKVPHDEKFAQRTEKTILRLEQLYYEIDNFFFYKIPKEDIKNIITKYDYLFTPEELFLLQSNNGIDCDQLNLHEIAKVLQKPYRKVTGISGWAYDKVENLYLDLYNNFVIEGEEIYLKYIKDLKFPMEELNREVCKLRFENHFDYKAIKDLLHIETTQKVSNIIGKMTTLMDMHHYKVLLKPHYEEDKIIKMLNSNNILTDKEKEILKKHVIDQIEVNVLVKQYSINKRDLTSLMQRFHYFYMKYYGKKEISYEEFAYEVTAHPTDSILNDNQRKIISMLYGIKSKYNIEGETYTIDEISLELSLEKEGIRDTIAKSKLMIGARLNGIISPNLGRLSRNEIIDILKDKNVPLSNEEKLLLQKYKGIELESKNLDELANEYNINKGSIRRRIQLSYIKILKYQENKEKNKVLDFTLDVEPLLKYFPSYEQNVLKNIYQEKYKVEDIMKNYGMTKPQARALTFKVEKRLRYYIKCPGASKFDFDYARSVLLREDLPYYADKDLAIQIYTQYFGDDGTTPLKREQIIKKNQMSEHIRTDMIVRSLMVSCLMYQEGYKKVKEIKDEEVLNFYYDHKEEYPKRMQKLFLNIKQDKNLFNGNRKNDVVYYEIIKDRGENIFDLRGLTQMQAYQLIVKNEYDLSAKQLDSIRNYYAIPKRMLMSGKEKYKLFKSLNKPITKHVKKLVRKQKMKTRMNTSNT